MKRKNGFNILIISSGIISTTIMILFQKSKIIDIPLWIIWNLIISGVIYQIGKLMSKGSNDIELKCHNIIQILSIIISSYYVITHHNRESEFRLIVYNYLIFFAGYFILTLSGFIIVSLYGILDKNTTGNSKLKENGLLEFMNETQLRALLHESLKNEDYLEAEKIQNILDKKFP